MFSATVLGGVKNIPLSFLSFFVKTVMSLESLSIANRC